MHIYKLLVKKNIILIAVDQRNSARHVIQRDPELSLFFGQFTFGPPQVGHIGISGYETALVRQGYAVDLDYGPIRSHALEVV